MGSLSSRAYASNNIFVPQGAGAQNTTSQIKEQQIVSLFDFLTDAQKADFSANTATLDISAGLAAFFAYLNATATLGYVPPGTGLHATSIQMPNSVTVHGCGAASKFSYTGVLDQWFVSNPSNASTAARISIRDLFLSRTQAIAGKANFVDNGSTYLTLKNVIFNGAAINVILDQSELVDITECEFGAIGTIGLWIVNGAQRTAGNLEFFSNRIGVQGCQFNAPAGAWCIADDGGYAHSFKDNNYNGGGVAGGHIRAAAVGGLIIHGGESEGATTGAISFQATKVGGAASSRATSAASVIGLLFANTVDLLVGVGAIIHIDWLDNTTSNAGNPYSGVNNCTDTHFEGNTNIGIGSTYTQINNYFENLAWTPTLSFGGASVNMTYGIQQGAVTRRGRQIILQGNITLTAKGISAGASAIGGLPWGSLTLVNYSAICPCFANAMAAGLGQMPIGTIGSASTTIFLYKMVAGAATAVPDTDFGNTSNIAFSIEYLTANQVN